MEVTSNERLEGFVGIFGAAQAIGIMLVLMAAYWSISYGGGFAWTGNPVLQFNWHPFLMIVGMIYLQGSSMLIYRGFRNSHKKSLKLAHGLIHGVAIVFVLTAAVAVFDNHNLSVPPKANLYSLHSWIGALTSTSYVLQWIGSGIVYMYPGLSNPIRTTIMPYHVFFGHVIFVMGIVAAISGITEKAIYTFGSKYGDLGAEAVIMNFMGLLIVAFGVLVVYLTTKVSYKRYPRPEDNELLNRLPSD